MPRVMVPLVEETKSAPDKSLDREQPLNRGLRVGLVLVAAIVTGGTVGLVAILLIGVVLFSMGLL
jgi:hypothetical protein